VTIAKVQKVNLLCCLEKIDFLPYCDNYQNDKYHFFRVIEIYLGLLAKREFCKKPPFSADPLPRRGALIQPEPQIKHSGDHCQSAKSQFFVLFRKN
jgi:hypothetical protein